MLTDRAARPPMPRRRAGGMTLIELMVTVTLLVLLLLLAMPSFQNWSRNAQVRAISDALQNGLRLAQAESVRRSRQVVFFLTDDRQCDATTAPISNGRYWALRTVALFSGEATETLQCGLIVEGHAGSVLVDGPTAICFNSMGRQVANASPGAGSAACSVTTGGTSTYDVSHPGADRPLRVLVTVGGQVRLCDPARTLSATAPDGCP